MVAGEEQALAGLGFAIMASAAFVVMSSAARDLPRACGPLIVPGVGLTLSGALLAIALPGVGAQMVALSVSADWQVIGPLLYFGLVPTALADVAYSAGMVRCRSQNVGLFATMGEAAIAALLAWVLLQERLHAAELGGCLLVIGAMLVLRCSEQIAATQVLPAGRSQIGTQVRT